MSLDNLHSSFQSNEWATEEEISEAEQAVGFELPMDYREFLLQRNGGEGFVGSGSYLVLWAATSLAEFNRDYETSKHCPGVLLIGSNGGGEAFGIYDREDGAIRFVQIPFIGMERSLLEEMATSFKGFLIALSERS